MDEYTSWNIKNYGFGIGGTAYGNGQDLGIDDELYFEIVHYSINKHDHFYYYDQEKYYK